MPDVADPVAVDTSVAVPLLVQTHLFHSVVRRWRAGRSLVLAGHAAVETYSVLTRLPGDLRIEAATAAGLLAKRFGEPLTLGADVQRDLAANLAQRHVSGGAVYDALVALAAREHGLSLATRDARARGTYERMGVEVLVVK